MCKLSYVEIFISNGFSTCVRAVAIFGFSENSYTGSENTQMATITLSRSGGVLTFPIGLAVSNGDPDTATSGMLI